MVHPLQSICIMNHLPKTFFATCTALVVVLFFSFTGLPFKDSTGYVDDLTQLEKHGYAAANPIWMLLPCSNLHQGIYGGTGYYRFPEEGLNLDCTSIGSATSLEVRALDVPNRFLVRRNGSIVAASRWLGCTTDYGPWGGPFCNSGTATLTFTRKTGKYTLQVETLTSTQRDAWECYPSPAQFESD